MDNSEDALDQRINSRVCEKNFAKTFDALLAAAKSLLLVVCKESLCVS
jgi:hypothetical protein